MWNRANNYSLLWVRSCLWELPCRLRGSPGWAVPPLSQSAPVCCRSAADKSEFCPEARLPCVRVGFGWEIFLMGKESLPSAVQTANCSLPLPLCSVLSSVAEACEPGWWSVSGAAGSAFQTWAVKFWTSLQTGSSATRTLVPRTLHGAPALGVRYGPNSYCSLARLSSWPTPFRGVLRPSSATDSCPAHKGIPWRSALCCFLHIDTQQSGFLCDRQSCSAECMCLLPGSSFLP